MLEGILGYGVDSDRVNGIWSEGDIGTGVKGILELE